ncbi:hypothetical protein STVIR_8091 [Streptomyces viridochromogenes Tue57]|uniref:Radical SAM core domain-containing protein n=1 Tax=Streptomyces viridochromogenes Tue57 TaxID=1160705 RepID=L8P6I1_STRVR|nr:hypothetical protein STVIR_8091 [Streptomyces viridochromogenes Tue57]
MLRSRTERDRGEARERAAAMLIDTYGRVATDLRVSLTDRCNLRCAYCMPQAGLPWLPRPDLLTDDEAVRLVRIAVTHLGVEEVRFTGGEPLPRPGLVGIVERCAALAPRPRLSLTTNGIGPGRTAEALERAGLDRVKCLAGHTAPRRLRGPDPVGPPPRRASGPGRGSCRRAHPGEGRRRPEARSERRRSTRTTRLDHGERLRTPVHRADAARHPARPATRRHDHRRGNPGEPEHPLHALPSRTRHAVPRPPNAGSSTAARPGSASSPPSPAPSAAPATAPGSPPTARCAPACSPGRSPTCEGRCAPRRRTRRSRGCGSARCGGRRPVPASTSRPSSSPSGRCRPSAADAPGVERNDVHGQNQE